MTAGQLVSPEPLLLLLMLLLLLLMMLLLLKLVVILHKIPLHVLLLRRPRLKARVRVQSAAPANADPRWIPLSTIHITTLNSKKKRFETLENRNLYTTSKKLKTRVSCKGATP